MNISTSFAILAFLVTFKPFEKKMTIRMEVFNEISLIIMTEMFFTFSDLNNSQEAKNLFGWVLVGLLLFNVCVNTAVMIVQSILLAAF